MNPLPSYLIALILLAAFQANSVLASDTERLVRMKNTIDELSARIAELKTENQHLESALREALLSSRTGRRVVSGCDVENAKDNFLYETNAAIKGSKLMSWMKRNGKQCDIAQLRELRAYAVAIPLGFGEPIVTLVDDLIRN